MASSWDNNSSSASKIQAHLSISPTACRFADVYTPSCRSRPPTSRSCRLSRGPIGARIPINSLSTVTNTSQCSTAASALKSYTYYEAEMYPLTWDSTPPANGSCDAANLTGHFDGTCYLNMNIETDSKLVTVQASGRGTDTLQILIDEGSILGGTLFFTWFFGIFAV
jgi:hypothetical protein